MFYFVYDCFMFCFKSADTRGKTVTTRTMGINKVYHLFAIRHLGGGEKFTGVFYYIPICVCMCVLFCCICEIILIICFILIIQGFYECIFLLLIFVVVTFMLSRFDDD